MCWGYVVGLLVSALSLPGACEYESLSVRGGRAVGVSHISHVRVIVQLKVDRENCTDI